MEILTATSTLILFTVAIYHGWKIWKSKIIDVETVYHSVWFIGVVLLLCA